MMLKNVKCSVTLTIKQMNFSNSMKTSSLASQNGSHIEKKSEREAWGKEPLNSAAGMRSDLAQLAMGGK